MHEMLQERDLHREKQKAKRLMETALHKTQKELECPEVKINQEI
jgi:hypothetical protein|tara:strand:+ start:384 stop:515 length:132 start_codon:yes stop_codon:yes gene_type:complete